MAEELISKNNLKFKLNFGADKAGEAGLTDIARGLTLALGYVEEEQVYLPDIAKDTARVKNDAYWAHEKNRFGSWLRCSNCDYKIEDDIWGGMYPKNYCPKCGLNMLGYVEKDGNLKDFKKEKEPT